MSETTLEAAIGREVRAFRTQLGLTIVELAKQAGLSAGMLSKVERGLTPPSLSTIEALANALNVPVTALFRSFEEQHDASFVPAGKGLVIERRGTRVGHRYELLGHTVGKRVSVEPYLISLDQQSEVFPLFQHAGVELIHVLEGEMVYRAAGATYPLGPGDSLMFDSDMPHGPEELVRLPIRFLSVITRAAAEE
jgi:transcriptional regulator with XRE-family HTH domain